MASNRFLTGLGWTAIYVVGIVSAIAVYGLLRMIFPSSVLGASITLIAGMFLGIALLIIARALDTGIAELYTHAAGTLMISLAVLDTMIRFIFAGVQTVSQLGFWTAFGATLFVALIVEAVVSGIIRQTVPGKGAF